MDKIKIPSWSLFFDFHTMPSCPDVGKNFDAEVFASRVADCGVDYIVFPARCNMGMAYYDTKAGIRHPSLEYDLFGRLVESCSSRGIAVSAYVNAGLSHEEALRRRDWCVLTPEGYTHVPGKGPSKTPEGSFFRRMCYNTGYGEHLLEMLEEIVSGYPVAGLFLDCMGMAPCAGLECVKEMKESGMDPLDPEELRRFAHFSRLRIAEKISLAARKASGRNLLIYFNGIPFEDQKDTGTYLEYECLPTGGWGYESLPLYSRYIRTLGKPVLNMTGRFHRSWGDFGGIRAEAGLVYDCLYGLANGMRPTIGDHFHPRGDINEAVFSLYRKVYGNIRDYGPFFEDAVPETDIGLVAPDGFGSLVPGKNREALDALKGAARILCELQMQFDVVTGGSEWGKYKVLVLPDKVSMEGVVRERVSSHISAGGGVLASGWSGLDGAGGGFVMEDWGVDFAGEEPFHPAYFSPGERISGSMPEMPLVFYMRGVRVAARAGTEVLARIVAPYYNERWDGEHYFRYTPPDRMTGHPAVTLKGKTAFITHPVFSIYHECAPVEMRRLAGNLLGLLLPKPLIKTEGLPSFGRTAVSRKGGRRMVHVFCFVPERRGKSMDIIEEPVSARGLKLSLRVDGAEPARVLLAPGGRALPFTFRDGYVETELPEVRGYAMVVFEPDGASE